MKHTVNVNISGVAFIINHDCYVMLNKFLDQTRKSVIARPDAEQVIAEVEARIAEEILSVQGSDKPVSIDTIRPIIERMGGRVDECESSINGTQTENTTQGSTLTKRLFRNTDGAILGGVCKGMAVYFNIDVILLRILFLSPFVIWCMTHIWDLFVMHHIFASFNGTSVLVYIILWIVIPKARTPREKLEMTGDPITVDTISSHHGISNAVYVRRSPSVLGVIIRVIAIALGLSLLVSAIVASFTALFALSTKMSIHPNPIPELLYAVDLSFTWASLWAMALVLLPVIAIFYLILASCLSWKRIGLVVGIILLAWFALAVWALILVTSNMPEITSIINSFQSFRCR